LVRSEISVRLPLPCIPLHLNTSIDRTVNAAVAVAMTGARTMSRDYVEAVESSVKVAGHGVAFAADVVVLCEHLNQGRDSGIHSFIDDMRLIARLAQSETKTTHGRFGAIRLKLYQVCCGTRSPSSY
jgi:hypothetical protein